MNAKYLTLVFVLLIPALFLSACNGATDAPMPNSSIQAWVEYPYEGDVLPMGPVQLVVYASAAEGVSFIAIKVNGQSLPATTVAPLTADNSSRLVRVDYTWTPPVEGEYVVEAAGIGSSGASGGAGSTRFCIVTCETSQTSTPSAFDATGTPTPASGETGTPTPSIADIPTLTPSSGEMTVEFYADPASINAGSCSTLRWKVNSSETVSVYFSGDLVGASGNYQTCPCQSETHTLRVVKVNGASEDYYTSVNVNGSCNVEPPTTIPPTTAPPTVPPPPSDTSGPSINSFSVYWNGCSLYGLADITDPSGVSWAEFHFNFNDTGWAWIKMNQSGSEWTSQVGIDTFGAPGSVEYKVRTLDSLNNESWSGVSTKNFAYCGD
ncbi:MAG: hypothetical protein MUO77_15690 [Anaerolineales bacterium]|nr:hypothetical protein [Anaerolineales bacterium]